MVLLFALLLFVAPVVLTVLVVDTLLDAKRTGGLPPFNPTHRAYGA